MKMIRSNCTSACKFCQIKKVKCDNKRPCTQCHRRNLVCEPSDKTKKRGPLSKNNDKLKLKYILI